MKRIILTLAVILGIAPAVLSEPIWLDSPNGTPTANLQLPSFAPVVEKLSEAVVNISTEGEEKVAPPSQQFGRRGQPTPFDFFFGVPPHQQGKRLFSSLGSGFVIHPSGYIVTNYHVVEKAKKIAVSFHDERKTYNAKLIGGDPKIDIALLKVDIDQDLTAVVLGNSEEVKPGDWVVAIGNPFRLGHTATVGIVSAKSRRDLPGGGVGPYDDFIQTDASINPGNSGGPLFNTKGEVIGVNTAIFSPGRLGSTGFNIGIGFATPINLVKSVLPQLKEKGKVTRGWLGVSIQRITEDLANVLNLKTTSGALVAEVMPDSPGAKAGLARGDVIVRYDDQEITSSEDLPLVVANTPIGKKVDVVVVRGGSRKTIPVTISELKEDSVDEVTEAAGTESLQERFGLTIQEVTPDIARTLGLDDTQGLIVTDVLSGSAADSSGLERGDVIIEVDNQSVDTISKFQSATKELKKGEPALLLIRRRGSTIFLTLKTE